MKLLRVGDLNHEKPAIIDSNNDIRDISSLVKDLNPESLNFNTLNKIKENNLESFPKLSNKSRIGSCVSKPQKFIGIGLNYSAHAKEANIKAPEEPIVFFNT